MQQQQNSFGTGNGSNNAQGPAGQYEDVKNEDVKKMNVNPDPRANENIPGGNDPEEENASGVGSEITDGEAG